MNSKNRFADILEIAKNQGKETPYAEEGEGVQADQETLRSRSDTNQEQPGKRGRPKVGKRSNAAYTQITAYIRTSTHKNAKIALIKEGQRDMGELIDDLLSQWIEAQK
jgi:hypothetical protein